MEKVTPQLSICISGLLISGLHIILALDQMTDDSEEVDVDDEFEDDHSLGGDKE